MTAGSAPAWMGQTESESFSEGQACHFQNSEWKAMAASCSF